MAKYDIVHGVKLTTANDKVVEQVKKTKKSFEQESIKFWRTFFARGKTLIDVGTYSGLFTILAKLNNTPCVGYEPSEAAFNRAVENCKINNVYAGTIYNLAVSNRPGKIKISVPSNTHLSSASTSNPSPDKKYIEHYVDAICLDNIYLNLDFQIGCIKIDVEGFEQNVLEGAYNLIAKHKPGLIIEVLTDKDRHQITAICKNHGYKNIRIVDGRNLIAY